MVHKMFPLLHDAQNQYFLNKTSAYHILRHTSIENWFWSTELFLFSLSPLGQLVRMWWPYNTSFLKLCSTTEWLWFWVPLMNCVSLYSLSCLMSHRKNTQINAWSCLVCGQVTELVVSLQRNDFIVLWLDVLFLFVIFLSGLFFF
jgi:hypothetical protein